MYKFLKHTADVLFEVESNTLNGLFKDAALAVSETMVDLRTVKPRVKKTITLRASTVEDLLYNFLSEIIYLKDSEYILFSKQNVTVDAKQVELKSNLFGEKINQKKHKLGNDVKAVTMHMFKVEFKKGKWKAKVLLDV